MGRGDELDGNVACVRSSAIAPLAVVLFEESDKGVWYVRNNVNFSNYPGPILSGLIPSNSSQYDPPQADTCKRVLWR